NPVDMPRAARLSLALVLMLAVMSVAGLGLATGGIQPSGPLDGVSVQPGENTAVVTWNVTQVPAQVVVEYGVDNRYGVWSDTTAVLEPRSGSTTLTGLEPGTNYQFHVMAVTPSYRADATGSFGTSGPGANPSAAITPLLQSTATSTLFKNAPSTTA